MSSELAQLRAHSWQSQDLITKNNRNPEDEPHKMLDM